MNRRSSSPFYFSGKVTDIFQFPPKHSISRYRGFVVEQNSRPEALFTTSKIHNSANILHQTFIFLFRWFGFQLRKGADNQLISSHFSNTRIQHHTATFLFSIPPFKMNEERTTPINIYTIDDIDLVGIVVIPTSNKLTI